VLVLSGSLAVTLVPWAAAPADSAALASSAHSADSADTTDSTNTTDTANTADSAQSAGRASAHGASTPAGPISRQAPEDLLRDRLIAELQEQSPGAALNSLQRSISRKPALARHCASIARALGKAAVHKYGAQRAQRFSRPVCDTSFASGVAQLSN
jgi:hypothetical protein